MPEKEEKELRNAFNKVFDANEDVMNCGREACTRLMLIIKNYSTVDIGNIETGVMNVEAVKTVYHKLLG